MFTPFLVADPHSAVRYRLSADRLAELSLAPQAESWAPGSAIAEAPDPVWAESMANAPVETIAAVVAALEDLVLATPDLRLPSAEALPDSRAKRHLTALVALWQRLGDALPEGLATVRHVLELPHGRFLDRLPVVEGSLDPSASAAMRALHDRLKAEFGAIPAPVEMPVAPAGSRLHALQGGVGAKDLSAGPADNSLSFFGLRDLAACADFAAARARALIEVGVPAREIAVLTSADPGQLARAFAAQGVPLSGLPAAPPERDILGETALQLLLAKRSPTPAMVLASLALSPLMPWAAQTGRDLAESLMEGDFRGKILDPNTEHKALWKDVRASAASLQQLRFLIDRICTQLSEGEALRARIPLPAGDDLLDWEALLRSMQVGQAARAEAVRNLQGVSLWSALESPWRSCRHLILADFTEGAYPTRPGTNPMFLDSEIAAIRASTGLQLRDRAEGLSHSLALFDAQLRAVSESATFLVPWRDMSGGRLAPSTGLSLVGRAIEGIEEPANLLTDLSRLAPADWPIAYHSSAPLPEASPLPEALCFPREDLLALRREDDGTAKPQSPSRLEKLLVSPLAWLLEELGASDMGWSAEALDVRIKGNIAHEVFEHVFRVGEDLPDPPALLEAVSKTYDSALARHAGFLRSSAWEMERKGLEREIQQAAVTWRDHLQALGARIIGNEMWLAGEAHGIRLHGKADEILELPDGDLLIVDHKKSGTRNRSKRMEAGWDLQAGLYRDMIARPIRRDGDGMDKLIGHTVGIAYHLMNDGGLLTSGVALANGSPARDMGEAVNAQAIVSLTERLAELGAGRVRLNTSEDEDFFEKEAGFKPYALTDGSPLVRAFIRDVEED
ncbi:PD-(D/E)XK nuclease family protein [Acidimangrovimonas pyrenivorans]|uniref:PD-(D/E)XK nuclease family protein n=1 Tax=Acidimangrovimonas pyrenivorans TaxID=2030798 RepID=A0ABV7AJB6_9RHOB